MGRDNYSLEFYNSPVSQAVINFWDPNFYDLEVSQCSVAFRAVDS